MDERFLTLDDIPRDARVVIYGTGAAAGTVLGRIRAERPDVAVPCLADSFSRGEALGLPVVLRGDLPTLSGGFDLVLIASAWWRDIGAALDADGITSWAAAAPVLWHKYIFSDDELRRAKPLLDAVEALLATERDREIFRFLTECRREGSPLVDTGGISPAIIDYLQVRDTLFDHQKGQYLDFVAREPVATLLHAGVFDGADCLRFLDAFPNLKALHGFEPQGTARIRPETLRAIEADGRVRIHPLGLWSHSCSLPLTGSGSFATLAPDAAPERAAGRVDTVSVDEFAAAHGIGRVDYLCLDVEGAEQRVLDGARRTIEAHRPQLAVCVYHRKEDFFRLPLALAERLDNYVFRLGHYCDHLNETVLYALPGELAD